MPGAFGFIDQLINCTIGINHVMAADFFFRVTHPVHRCLAIGQIRVMHDQDIRRIAACAVVKVRAGGLDDLHHILGRNLRLVRATARSMATVSLVATPGFFFGSLNASCS